MKIYVYTTWGKYEGISDIYVFQTLDEAREMAKREVHDYGEICECEFGQPAVNDKILYSYYWDSQANKWIEENEEG